jgi:hypothetical protein
MNMANVKSNVSARWQLRHPGRTLHFWRYSECWAHTPTRRLSAAHTAAAAAIAGHTVTHSNTLAGHSPKQGLYDSLAAALPPASPAQGHTSRWRV